MNVMDKRLLVSMPQQMFESIQSLSKKEYMSVSAVIRQAIKEYLEDVEDVKLYDKAKKSKSSPVLFK